MADFTINQDDLLPELQVTLKNADGTVEDPTGNTPTFFMKSLDGLKTVTGVAAIVDGPNGIVKFTWSGTDTDTVGNYQAKFEITVGGAQRSFPAAGHISVVIQLDRSK